MTASVCPSCGATVSPGARFCASCGAPVAEPAAEERKLATILFADVIGSTDLGEQLDPERLRALLQEYFAAMSRVIEEWGGTVEKYIGDAILAVFGVPVAREDDPVRALRAATDMLAALARLNDGFEKRHGVRLAVRIGVNSGEVLAPVGARPAGQFLVSGDPVNVAARLEQAAEPGTVLVGERTWLLARHAFAFGEPVPLAVKGKRQSVIARPLGNALAAEAATVAFQAPMVGRDRELETLLGLLDEAMETELPRLVVVSGPAGIGKSRLLREFVAAASERHDGLTVLRGRCLAAGHGITFWALGEVLRAACRISLDEPADSAAEKLRRSAVAVLEPLSLRSSDVEATVYALATSANLALPRNPLEGLEPEAVAEEMSRAWPRFLSGLAARSPTTVVLEDIHWADERMVAMLELLVTRSRGRLILIATARPEFIEAHPGFAASEELTVVPLRPLTDAQSEQLVEGLLGASDPLHALLAEVRQKAEGNPFFLEEILQRLVDEGALVSEAGRWRATERARRVALPDTIHAVLAARIDGLPRDEKGLLQQAAVVGRVFWPGALATAAGGSDSAGLLRSLERKGLITARPTSTIEGEREYIFRHILTRDVAYASVPKARRARAHAEVGHWIEELAGDRLEEFGELLAYHYSNAVAGEDADLAWADAEWEREGLRRRAFEVLLRAGAAARHRFAVEKALKLHDQALALATGDAEAARAHEELGDDHDALFRGDQAVAEYLAGVESVRKSGNDAETIGRLANKAGRIGQLWGAFRGAPPTDQIQALIEESLGRDISDRVRAGLLIRLAGIRHRVRRRSAREPLGADELRDLPARLASVEAGLAIARRLDDVDLQYAAYDQLETLNWTSGRYEDYRKAVEQKGELLERFASRRQQVDTLVSIASIRNDAGDVEGGLAAAEEALTRGADLSPHDRMHASWEVLWAAVSLGRWDRVLEILPWHAEAAAAEGDITCAAVRGGPFLGATILARRGEVEAARQLVPLPSAVHEREASATEALAALYAVVLGEPDVAARLVEGMTEGLDNPVALWPLIEVSWRLGRLETLEAHVAAARREARALAVLTPLADRGEAILAMAQGRPESARPLLVKALGQFEALSNPFEAAQTRELLASISEGAERNELLQRALETYESLGARPYAEGVRAALAQVASAL